MAMIDDGLLDQFGVEQVYGMHNWPGSPVGAFSLRKGPLMAAADEITITIEGKGGHGAMPHQGVDPVAYRRADHNRAADHHVAQRRSAGFERHLDHPLPGGHGQQHHPADRPG